jgi:hypothetical protein
MLSQLRCRFARAVQMATRGEGQRNGDGGEWWPGFCNGKQRGKQWRVVPKKKWRVVN